MNGLLFTGELTTPKASKRLVIFAHGGGEVEPNSRDWFIARKLHRNEISTLLISLLSKEEDEDYDKRFNVELLSERLLAITDWATNDKMTKSMNIGYLGSGTGGTAAILAAKAHEKIKAIVVRGGRVDLVSPNTKRLTTPTLLVVGHEDYGVLEANEEFFIDLDGPKELAIVPRATHLFEEPGSLDRVGTLASSWFKKYL
jgi:putative phosphoribosyl transferase